MNLLEFSKENVPPVGTPDAKGTPFDPGKHLPRVNSKTQRWLPRSPGRFNKGQTRLPGVDATTTPAAPADVSNPDMPPVQEVTADALLDLPNVAPAPAPEVKPGTPPPAPQPAASAPVPEVGPEAEASASGASADAPRGADAKASAAHAGKLAARATYAVTGALIRDHKAAKPSPDEHTALANTWTAFFEFRGVALVGSVAVGAAVLCYLLEDGRREPFTDFIKGLFKSLFGKKPEKRAEPVAAPVDNSAPSPTAATPQGVHHVRFPE